ncbi:MAG: MiaB/RimO family radical SAM methylthiotransferase [Treponema sp.]|nr:MiaB/RimO family radical SAM methylthiotransferase [Treponema sp.]
MLVSVLTLGCKLNQLESESIADAFKREGFSIFCPQESDGQEPDSQESDGQESDDREPDGLNTGKASLYIINTCTVTSKSEQKARRVIRKTLRDTPAQTVIIITGCYAQMEREALFSMDNANRLFVVSQEEKNRLLDLPGFLAAHNACGASPEAAESITELPSLIADWVSKPGSKPGSKLYIGDNLFCYNPGQFSFHSRAFVKIQDGCDNYCAYCRTRLARGKSRSLDPDKVLAAMQSLEEKGYNEAVLTGINISQYAGRLQDNILNLAGLLEMLLAGTGRIRIRLSSIEPGERSFSDDFLKAVSHPRVRAHFHISLQSGSLAVLERMNRPFPPDQTMEGLMRLRSAKSDPFLGCDIITGFPGESGTDFEKTYDFCQKTGFAGIHAFPFSRRPGTAAWNLKDRVTEKEAGIRTKKLIDLAVKQRREYINRWIGRETEAIAEAPLKNRDFIPLLSDNYLHLLLPAGEYAVKPGDLIRCRIAAGPRLPPRFDAEAEICL